MKSMPGFAMLSKEKYSKSPNLHDLHLPIIFIDGRTHKPPSIGWGFGFFAMDQWACNVKSSKPLGELSVNVFNLLQDNNQGKN